MAAIGKEMSELRKSVAVRKAIVFGTLVLIVPLLVPVCPAQAGTGPEPTLLAMSLFGTEEQKTPPPGPKGALPKPPPAPAKPAPSASPAPGTGPAATPAPVPGSPATPAAGGLPGGSASNPPVPPPPPQGIPPPPVSPAGAPGKAMTGSEAMGGPGPAPVPLPGESGITPPLPPPPADATGDGFTYDPKSRRDPFQSIIKMIKNERARAELPPLQRFELRDLKLLGIIWGGYGYHAMVQTPDGKGYTVKEGTLVGINSGVIKGISEKRIVVSEPTVDFAGKKTTREVEILLRPNEGIE